MRLLIVIALVLPLELMAQTVKLVPLRHKDLLVSQDRYQLSVEIDRMSVQELVKLKATTGFGPATISPTTKYQFIDFLPPLMQATLGKNLLSTTHKEPADRGSLDDTYMLFDENYEGNKLILGSSMNCWGTAWELARLLHPNTKDKLTFTSFWYGRWESQDIMESDQYASVVKGEKKFGDVVLYKIGDTGSEMLFHASTFVGVFGGKEIHFEKIDSADGTPFRLSYADDIRAKYSQVAKSKGSQLKIDYFRYNTPGKKPLPSPHELTIGVTDSIDFKKAFPKTGKAIANLIIMACGDSLGGRCTTTPILIQNYKLKLDTSKNQYIPDPAWLNNKRFVPAN